MRVCIETSGEGFAVYDEDAPDVPKQQAASVDEALEAARSLLGSGGDALGGEDMRAGAEEAAFQNGFAGA